MTDLKREGFKEQGIQVKDGRKKHGKMSIIEMLNKSNDKARIARSLILLCVSQEIVANYKPNLSVILKFFLAAYC